MISVIIRVALRAISKAIIRVIIRVIIRGFIFVDLKAIFCNYVNESSLLLLCKVM